MPCDLSWASPGGRGSRRADYKNNRSQTHGSVGTGDDYGLAIREGEAPAEPITKQPFTNARFGRDWE